MPYLSGCYGDGLVLPRVEGYGNTPNTISQSQWGGARVNGIGVNFVRDDQNKIVDDGNDGRVPMECQFMEMKLQWNIYMVMGV